LSVSSRCRPTTASSSSTSMLRRFPRRTDDPAYLGPSESGRYPKPFARAGKSRGSAPPGERRCALYDARPFSRWGVRPWRSRPRGAKGVEHG
jgi:hypothetical protein